MNTKYLTILISDIEGFTDKTSHLSRQELGRLLHLQDQLVRPIITRFKGKVVKTIGDAYLVTFISPTNAVLCGLQMQSMLSEHNKKSHPKQRLNMRIAVNSGEVNVIDQDVYGTTVNITARLQAITQPGKVYLTQATYSAINPIEVEALYLGSTRLKGISEAVKIYVAIVSPAKKYFWSKLILPFYAIKSLLLPRYSAHGVSYKLRFTLLLLIGAFTVSTISFAQNMETAKNNLLNQSYGEVKAELNVEDSPLPEVSVKPVATKSSTMTPNTSPAQPQSGNDDRENVTNVTHYYTYSTILTASPSATPAPIPSATPESSNSPTPTPAPSSTHQATESPSPSGS